MKNINQFIDILFNWFFAYSSQNIFFEGHINLIANEFWLKGRSISFCINED